jgi:hypothetical protein
MKILAARIKRQLLLDTGKWGHCAIYENELPMHLAVGRKKSKIKDRAIRKGIRISPELLQAGALRDV